MEAMDAMFQRFTVSITSTMNTKLYALEERMNTRIDAISRPSSPGDIAPLDGIAPQMTPQQSHQPPQVIQPAHEDKRWRPEEVGYFDGTGDVYTFIDRLNSVAANKGVKLVQTNLITTLKDKAFNWYHYELSKDTKDIYNLNALITLWCNAFIARFGPSHKELVARLEVCQYTRKDAANRKDVTEFIQEVMKITKYLQWPQQDGLMTAFHHFEAGLQRDLNPPSDLTSFIKQVQLRQEAWYQVYVAFDKPRPPDVSRSQQYQPRQPPSQQPYQPRQQ